MVLNLSIMNVRPLRPHLSCLKRIGPLDVSLIPSDTSAKRGGQSDLSVAVYDGCVLGVERFAPNRYPQFVPRPEQVIWSDRNCLYGSESLGRGLEKVVAELAYLR